MVTNFGFNEYILANSKDEKTLKTNFLGFFLFSLIILLGILFLIVFINISDYLLLVLIAIKIFLDTSLVKILLAYHQVKKTIPQLTFVYFISSIVILALISLVYICGGSVYSYLASYIIGLTLIYIISLYNIKPQLNIPVSQFYKKNVSKIKYYGLSYITVSLYMLIPNAIAAVMIPKKEMALYQASYSIANVILLVSVSFIQYSYSKLIGISKREIFKKELLKIIKQVILINTFVIFFFFFFGEYILTNTYGSIFFKKGLMPLLLLLIANLIQSVSAVLIMPLVIVKMQKIKYYINIELIVITSISSTILIYMFSYYGIIYSFILIYIYSFFRFARVNQTIIKNYDEYVN